MFTLKSLLAYTTLALGLGAQVASAHFSGSDDACPGFTFLIPRDHHCVCEEAFGGYVRALTTVHVFETHCPLTGSLQERLRSNLEEVLRRPLLHAMVPPRLPPKPEAQGSPQRGPPSNRAIGFEPS